MCVLGAGPAGAHLALTLAEHDVDVTLIAPRQRREKPCGGGVGLDALGRYPIFAGSPFVDPTRCNHCSDAVYVGLDGREVPYRMPETMVIANRLAFDGFLRQKAVEAGAHHLAARVLAIDKTRDGWRLTTTKGVVHCRMLAGADGVGSLVRKTTLGPIPRTETALTVGCFVRGVPAEDLVFAWREVQGYLWSFPRRENASVGVAARADSCSATSLWGIVNGFLEQRYPAAVIESRWSAPLPTVQTAQFFDSPCSGKGFVLVGDAAGHVDPVLGAGIGYALHSGLLAARAIIDGNLAGYEDSWRSAYGRALSQRSEVARRARVNSSADGPAVWDRVLRAFLRVGA